MSQICAPFRGIVKEKASGAETPSPMEITLMTKQSHDQNTVCLLCGELCPSGTLDTGLCSTCDYKELVMLVGSMAANLRTGRRLGWSAMPNKNPRFATADYWTAYVVVKRKKWYGKRTAYGERMKWVEAANFPLRGRFATRSEAMYHAKRLLALAEAAK